jgi:hypothetical protein
MPFDICNPARQALGWMAQIRRLSVDRAVPQMRTWAWPRALRAIRFLLAPRLPVKTSERYPRGGTVARACGGTGRLVFAVCVAGLGTTSCIARCCDCNEQTVGMTQCAPASTECTGRKRLDLLR